MPVIPWCASIFRQDSLPTFRHEVEFTDTTAAFVDPVTLDLLLRRTRLPTSYTWSLLAWRRRALNASPAPANRAGGHGVALGALMKRTNLHSKRIKSSNE